MIALSGEVARGLTDYRDEEDGMSLYDFKFSEKISDLDPPFSSKLPKRAEKAPEIPVATTSHDLRHHFAAVLLAAGESVVAVAEWLGHENATLVLTTYGHLMANGQDRMRKAVDAAYDLTPSSSAPTVPQRSAGTS